MIEKNYISCAAGPATPVKQSSASNISGQPDTKGFLSQTKTTAAKTFLDRQQVVLPNDWKLSDRVLCDLELLLQGALAPLSGFMTEEEYYSVLQNMKLPNGAVFPMPIVLPIPKGTTSPNLHWIESTRHDQQPDNIIKLRDSVGTIIAELHVESIYEPNLKVEMESVLRTTYHTHPYVKYLSESYQNCYYVGGRVTAVNPITHFDFNEYRLGTDTVKEIIKQKNHKTVVGFQTRNPMHISHFQLVVQCMRKAQRETGSKPLLLLTPAAGPTQAGDIDFHIRVQCYKKILKRFADLNIDVILVLLPLAMRMAGPKEALWHALIRKNYGCTHFIVGRDHAGPSTRKADGSTFYQPYDAHELINSVSDKIGIKPLFGYTMCYVGEQNGGYIQEDEIKPGMTVNNISGTEIRRMLVNREKIPEWYSFPEIVEELQKYFKPLYETGSVIYFTGLPCSGKSALANAVKAALLENDNERRAITLLDADIVREHLSQGLGFSREDRSVNVRRIGYVASEIAKHGGICLVANIAPYESDRKYNRNLITSQNGKYIEVYVSTPLEVCEKRDVKDLFKKARQGIVKQFTGISDPYDIPANAELTINSSSNLPQLVQTVLQYLQNTSVIQCA